MKMVKSLLLVSIPPTMVAAVRLVSPGGGDGRPPLDHPDGGRTGDIKRTGLPLRGG